jgi:hypothetical protein|tara:strand:- start:2336 stop:3481 length:1146 start_codon:yes stop_codon:yes gene_type:complete
MAIYKLFPTKDATLYSMFPNMNTGLDEIIEASETSISPEGSTNPQVSRFLINFNQNSIEDIFNNKVNGAEWDVNLRCFIAKTTGLSLTTTLDIFAVSGTWDMGTGKYLDSPISTDGCSWIFQAYSGSTMWNVLSPGNNVTSSYNYNYAPLGGGTWYSNKSNGQPLSSSQVYTYNSDVDLNTSVKSIVDIWLTGSIGILNPTVTNDGFLIKQRTEFINSNDYQPEIKFFSTDTHTIYPPQLEFKWDDFTYETGSLNVLETLPAKLTLAQNPGTFYSESINRFRINARPEYPRQVWQTSSLYTTNYALPTASYWALKDLDTNEYVIGFDKTYTKLSCDNSGSYLDMYMNGLQPERYYQILIQTEIDGSTIVFDDQYYFKVING